MDNFKMKLDTKHHAFSNDCKILERKYMEEKKKVEREQQSVITRARNHICDLLVLNLMKCSELSVKCFECMFMFIMLCSVTCLTENIKKFEVIVEICELFTLKDVTHIVYIQVGVAVYIRQCIDYKVVHNTCFSKNIWFFGVWNTKLCFKKSSSVPHYLSIDIWDPYDPNKMCVTIGDFNIYISKILDNLTI